MTEQKSARDVVAEALAECDGNDEATELHRVEAEHVTHCLTASGHLRDVEALRAENERLRETLTWVLDDIQNWCKAVDRDSSWDGWDHHYKAFAYGGLEKARAALDAKP